MIDLAALDRAAIHAREGAETRIQQYAEDAKHAESIIQIRMDAAMESAAREKHVWQNRLQEIEFFPENIRQRAEQEIISQIQLVETAVMREAGLIQGRLEREAKKVADQAIAAVEAEVTQVGKDVRAWAEQEILRPMGAWFYDEIVVPILGDGPGVFSSIKDVVMPHLSTMQLLGGGLALMVQYLPQLSDLLNNFIKDPAKLSWVADYDFQKARWQALMDAASGGPDNEPGWRLPYYDRFFRMRAINFYGRDEGTEWTNADYFGEYSWRGGETFGQNALFACLPRHVQALLITCYGRLGYAEKAAQFAEVVDALAAWKLKACEPVTARYFYLRETSSEIYGWWRSPIKPLDGWPVKPYYPMDPRVAPPPPPSSWATVDGGQRLATIPAEWCTDIPEAYAAFWLAPDGADWPALLATLERERDSMGIGHFKRDNFQPTVNSGWIHGPKAWGKNMLLDFGKWMTDPEVVQRMWATRQSAEKSSLALSPERHEKIISQFLKQREGAYIQAKRLFDIRSRPEIREAIAWSKAVKIGAERPIQDAKTMIHQVTRTADPVKAYKTGALSTAIIPPVEL